MAGKESVPESLNSSQQDPEERRKIRSKYRTFISELQEKKDDLINPDSNQLNESLSEADELFEPVQLVREVALDSQAVSLIATFGRLKAQALNTEFLKFQPADFASKIMRFIGGKSADLTDGVRILSLGWTRFGKAVQPSFKQSPPFQYMLGSFERGSKPVKVRQQRVPKEKDDIVGKETVPQQLKDFNSSDQNEATTEEVERVYQCLKNLYDGEGPVDPEEKQKKSDDGNPQVNQQTVITLTQDEWRELVKVFNIEEACIQPTEPIQMIPSYNILICNWTQT